MNIYVFLDQLRRSRTNIFFVSVLNRCSTDFAEVPSTLMEYFASDPRVLARINKHYKTGESLPLHVIEKLCATKKIFAAVELQAQLVFSAADQVGVYSLHL